jgi:putative flippase GtrA
LYNNIIKVLGGIYILKKILNQILKFGIVGFIATLIDYLVLILLTEIFDVYYLLSSCISFTVSVIFNYIASMKYVFEGKNNNKIKEFFLFIILSIVGLIINTILMKLFVETFYIHYIISKIITTAFVMIYNFISRKLLLEKKD